MTLRNKFKNGKDDGKYIKKECTNKIENGISWKERISGEQYIII